MTKKYGQHFNNNTHSDQQVKVNQAPPPEYLASVSQTSSQVIDDESLLSDTQIPSQINVSSTDKSEPVDLRRYQFSVIRKNNRARRLDKLESQARGKMYPLAPIGFFSALIGSIGIVASISTSTLSLPLAGLFILGGIFGFISLKKTKRSKWKGRGFAVATVVLIYAALGVLLAGLIGIIAFIASDPQ